MAFTSLGRTNSNFNAETSLKSSYLDSLSGPASPVGTGSAPAYSAAPSAQATSSFAPAGMSAPAPQQQTDNFKSSQRWRKKTKQLATLGPASSSFEMIEKLFLAGADVFRLNFSHGEHAQKKELLDIIRQVEAKYDHPIAVLGDLQGPKLRVGTFANSNGEMLQAGQIFRFDLDQTPGTNQRVLLPHPEIIEASEVGHVLLIDDGKVKMQVVATGPGYLDCEVVVPGLIKDKKVCAAPTCISYMSMMYSHFFSKYIYWTQQSSFYFSQLIAPPNCRESIHQIPSCRSHA
jgi:pyruvate kinase